MDHGANEGRGSDHSISFVLRCFPRKQNKLKQKEKTVDTYWRQISEMVKDPFPDI